MMYICQTTWSVMNKISIIVPGDRHESIELQLQVFTTCVHYIYIYKIYVTLDISITGTY